MSAGDSSQPVQYRLVPDFPLYEVGDDGSIWSFAYGRRTKRKPFIDDLGYHKITLCRDGRTKTFGVGEVVLSAFVGPRPPGKEVCHFPDRTPGNNRLENLRWDTHANNVADKIPHGTHQIGETHPRSKLTEAIVLAIDAALCDGEAQASIAERFGICIQEVEALSQRRLWPHVPRQYDGNANVSIPCSVCGCAMQVKRRFATRRKVCSKSCEYKRRWARMKE